MTSAKKVMFNGVECVMVASGIERMGYYDGYALIEQLAKDLGCTPTGGTHYVCGMCTHREDINRCTCPTNVLPDAKYEPLLRMRGIPLAENDDAEDSNG